MNSNQTVEKLRQMRLSAMAELHYQNVRDNRFSGFTPDEYIALLADHEWEDRQSEKMTRFIKAASFKQKASLADIDYSHSRNLERNMFDRLASLTFITRRENIIVTGPSGVGKSYIAQSIGNQACLMGYRTLYTNTSRLLSRLKLSKLDGTYFRELKKLQKTDLLILDDFGLQGFDATARELLIDIIDDSWASDKTIPPYYIYLKTAYHLSQEARNGISEYNLPIEFNILTVW
jgi:DNA replication protein DnaC